MDYYPFVALRPRLISVLKRKTVFNEEKCAILAFPYMSISFHLAETKRIPEEDKQLMRDIIKLTPRPHFIRNAVTEFIEKVQIFV